MQFCAGFGAEVNVKVQIPHVFIISTFEREACYDSF